MSKITRHTEKSSEYRHLEKMSFSEIIHHINEEDQKVAFAVKEQLSSIESLASAVHVQMEGGGRLFYVGAGTSGRLGVVDASECPPTFGVPHGRVIGIMAGGDVAIRKSVEFAEDDENQCWKDLQVYDISPQDFVVGIAASGTTPYVVGGLKDCRSKGIKTGCITCNEGTPLASHADHTIEVVVGPEFLTGSTRMKSGTAQKMILNMISTSVMIKLGFVYDNKMIDMQIANNKLVDRGTNLVSQFTGLEYAKAKELLLQHGSVRKAMEEFGKNTS